ncbi:hypothetical protein GY45DRAFT_1428245 [Cubamyces sp. BRFM 1775]|nr:hypothetical protein GY45DRAFT_1428245 [Cubamyces sp. BRFM 1775]
MGRQTKSRRTTIAQSTATGLGAVSQAAIASSGSSLLERLPLELLAEVLSYCSTTRDVLALARTCKHFCNVLVKNPSTDFIWRQVRARTRPRPMPDPMPGLAEATYAALVFEAGNCESCGQRTRWPYLSFALRLRICEKVRPVVCSVRAQNIREISLEDEAQYPDILQWIPRRERDESDLTMGNGIYVRRDSWKKAIDEFRRAQELGPDAMSAYTETKQVMADALPAKLEFYRKLCIWRNQYTTEYQRNITSLEASARANKAGYTKWELMQSPTYSSIHHAKARCLENWHHNEYERIENKVLAEIIQQMGRKINRERVHALTKRRHSVEGVYKCFQQDTALLPPLYEFRHLSVVKTYEGSSSNKGPGLSDSFISEVLKDNLEQWVATARANLAVSLGFPGWKTMSKRLLHPVDRLTARFLCKKCSAAGKDGGKDGSMDFAGACRHECARLSKKARATRRWDAYNFVPDQQAIDALTQVLELCGAKAEEVDSLRIVDSVGARIQCTTCKLTMDVRSVGHHCKRHDEGSFVLLPAEDIADIEPPAYGLSAKLLETSAEAASQRDEKAYGCRLCMAQFVFVASGGSAGTDGDQNSKRAQYRPKWMSFNGLRSHLKEKHGIGHPADEDFYRTKVPASDSDSTSR